MKIEKLKIALVVLIGSITLGIILSSCSSSKKIKESSYKKTDSTGTTISQASGVSLTDSSRLKTSEQSNSEEITLYFADEASDTDSTDAVEKAIDLAGPKSTVKVSTGIHKVTIGGKEISSSRPIKSVTIKTDEKTKVIDLSQLVKKDSGQKTDQSTVTVAKVEEVKKKDVEKHGANVLIWLGLGLGTLAILIVAYRFGFFDKRKNITV